MTEENDSFAEARALESRLLAQLRASPIVDVAGVVAPSGVAGVRSHGDEFWTVVFGFLAWRVEKEELQTQQLAIRRHVVEEEIDRFRELLVPYSVMRIRARVVADSVFGSAQALLEFVVGPDSSDAVLNDQAVRLQEPVEFDDPVFGTFTLNRRYDWFTADTVWDGDVVSLNLMAEKPTDHQAALKVAHALWDAENSWSARIRDYAVCKLLPLKNDNWLDEDETEITADQFNERMSLESVTVYPDGEFEFWHEDGDLFWGHSILIKGSLLEGPTEAGLHG
jgi:hypothetical protein